MTSERWRQATEWPLMVAALVFLAAYSVQVIANVSERQAQSLEVIQWIT